MFGMFKSFAGQLEEVNPELAGKLGSFIPSEKPPPPDNTAPVQRWEKAILAVKGIAQQVSKMDKDGLEVMVAGDDVQSYKGIKDVKGLMRICDGVEPEGGLNLGAAIVQALDIATERLYGEQSAPKTQSILVLLSRKPDDAEDLVEVVKASAAKVKQESDLCITFVHVGNDPEASEYLDFIDNDLKVTSEETGEPVDIVDTVKDEDIKKAFEETQDPGFMASGGTGALLGAFAGAAAGAGGYYMYQKHCIDKRTKGFNGSWYVVGYDGQKTQVRLKIKDDMEGNLDIQGYPDEAPEDFEDDGEEEDWDDEEDCPCCQGRGFFDKWCRPCDESDMFNDLECPVCAGEGYVTGCMKRCRRCQGLGAFDIWGRPCMRNAMHYERDCRKCNGKCFFPTDDEEPEWEEEDEEPPPLWGRSTAKAKYQGEKCWRFTADAEEVIPGSLEDESTVVWEDGTRWEEKKEKVSHGKTALAGLGGAVLGGAAGYLIQKKFFNKASKKTPGDYIIILDRSAAMGEMDG